MAHQIGSTIQWLEQLATEHVKQDWVVEKLKNARKHAVDHEAPTYVVTTAQYASSVDSLAIVVDALSSDETFFYWSPSEESRETLAAGCAASFELASRENLAPVLDAVSSCYVVDEQAAGFQWFGGLAFADRARQHPWEGWPTGYFFLPMFKFVRTAEGEIILSVTWKITTTTNIDERIAEYIQKIRSLFSLQIRSYLHSTDYEPEYSVSKNNYLTAIGQISGEIARGEYEKAVFARYESIHVPKDFRISRALHKLRTQYPSAFVFAFGHLSDVFLGATPERLVKVRNRSVFVDCLAGTAPRGETMAQDERLGKELLDSSKNRREHSSVVNWVKEQLVDFVDNLSVPEVPELKKLNNVQHLLTPVSGRLKSTYTLFDLVQRLHPTPAVAGVPRESALRTISMHEGMDRGWYAGPIGWFDAQGDGDFAVALRSGLLKEAGVAYLFAGGGIMEDSDPAIEWTETDLKLIPMKSAFEA